MGGSWVSILAYMTLCVIYFILMGYYIADSGVKLPYILYGAIALTYLALCVHSWWVMHEHDTAIGLKAD
jgi:hypothetical protein